MKRTLPLLIVASSVALILSGCAGLEPQGFGKPAPIVNVDGSAGNGANGSGFQGATVHGVANQQGFQGENVGGGNQENGHQGAQMVGAESAAASGFAALPKTVYFGFDQFHLNAASKKVADQNAKYLLQNPNVKVLLSGNTDPQGSQEYNFHLGKRRANAVYDYLASQGVPKSQMCTVSYGDLRPEASPSEFGGDWHKAYATDRRTVLEYNKDCSGQSHGS